METIIGLPELVGSEKQTKWAADLRARLIRDNKGQESNPLLIAALKITSAKFWIETRNLDMVRFTNVLTQVENGYSLEKAFWIVNKTYCKF